MEKLIVHEILESKRFRRDLENFIRKIVFDKEILNEIVRAVGLRIREVHYDKD